MNEPPEPIGPVERNEAQPPPFPMSIDSAVAIIKYAMRRGQVQITDHFRSRCLERGFNDVDAGRIVRFGRLIGSPRFNDQYGDWAFKFEGVADGRAVEIRLALDPRVDFEDPLLILITVIPKGTINVPESAEI